MEITLINRTNKKIYIYQSLFNKIGFKTEQVLKLKEKYVISVTFVRSQTMHKLNRDYRNIDRPTDVITFALEDNGKIELEGGRVLGDIYISIDKAKEQAKEYNHSLKRELSFLMVHGFLHLLGYDHMNEEDEKVMFDKQERILDSYGITR